VLYKCLIDVAITLTLLSRRNNAGLSVASSVHKQFFRFHWNLVCKSKGYWVLHGGMPYDPIQCQGHERRKVVNGQFQSLSPPPLYMWSED